MEFLFHFQTYCIILVYITFLEIARQIMEPLEKMRRENDLVKVFPSFLTGEDFFGLTDPSILKIIESVCSTYAVDLIQ